MPRFIIGTYINSTKFNLQNENKEIKLSVYQSWIINHHLDWNPARPDSCLVKVQRIGALKVKYILRLCGHQEDITKVNMKIQLYFILLYLWIEYKLFIKVPFVT